MLPSESGEGQRIHAGPASTSEPTQPDVQSKPSERDASVSVSRTDAAKAYQARGWRTLQLHGVAYDGLCTCRDRTKPGHDKQAGKHPRDNGWQNAEPMTDAEIEKAFGGAIACNVGIATGTPSGFFVLDIDPDNGWEGLRRLEADHGPLAPSCVVKTGSGGRHYYFTLPEDFEPTNRKGGLKEYDGLDVRGTGGQVVAPPSVSGKGPYTWERSGHPEPAPDWLMELSRDRKSVV